MYDGSLCHQSDPNCTGEPFECHFAMGPVQPTVPNKPSTMPLLPVYNRTTPAKAMPGGSPGQGQPSMPPVSGYSTVKIEPAVANIYVPTAAAGTGAPTWTTASASNVTNTTAAPGGGFFSWFGFR